MNLPSSNFHCEFCEVVTSSRYVSRRSEISDDEIANGARWGRSLTNNYFEETALSRDRLVHSTVTAGVCMFIGLLAATFTYAIRPVFAVCPYMPMEVFFDMRTSFFICFGQFSFRSFYLVLGCIIPSNGKGSLIVSRRARKALTQVALRRGVLMLSDCIG